MSRGDERWIAALQRARAELLAADEGRATDVVAAIDRALDASQPSHASSPARPIERHELLDAVLRRSPHGVMVCDARGRIVLQNEASARIWAGRAAPSSTASTASEDDGRSRRAFHPDGRPYAVEDWAMARALATGAVIEAEEVHFQRLDGTHGALIGGAAPLLDARGDIIGALAVFADVTSLKRIEALKDRWVAVASHEIRNFLAVVKIRVDMASRALEKKREFDVGELLAVLKQSVDELNALLGEMLDLSRAQAGALAMHEEDVAIDEVVRRVAEPLVGASSRHALRLDLDRVVVRADPLRCEQVLQNLVQNALRYSPSGGEIVVRASARGRFAEIEVQDHGVGFEPEQAERLFEPFVRLDVSGAEGMGVGLYLARELVERMGGRIVCSSAGLGQGATFGFTLPLCDLTPHPPLSQRESGSAG